MSQHSPFFIHPLAFVCGDVVIGAGASVWPFAVVRGDTERIEIGEDSNLQDGVVVHTDHGLPTVIGRRVGVGHRAIIHASVIEDDCLIGMGAVLLNGVRVGTGSIVAAGAVCREGMQIPSNSLVLGVPARVVRATTESERARIRHTVESYLALQRRHRDGEFARVES